MIQQMALYKQGCKLIVSVPLSRLNRSEERRVGKEC